MANKLRILFSIETGDKWILQTYKSFFRCLAEDDRFEIFCTASDVDEQKELLAEHNIIDYQKIPLAGSDVLRARLGKSYSAEFAEQARNFSLWGTSQQLLGRFEMFRIVLSFLQPDIVIVWNGMVDIRGMVRWFLSKRRIPFFYAEKGMLPNSWYIDEAGINARCSLDTSCLSTTLETTEQNQIQAYIQKIANSGSSAWDQPRRNRDICSLKEKLGISPDSSVIFFPGQVDEDANITKFSPFANVAEAISLTLAAMPPGATLVVKTHPKSKQNSKNQLSELARRSPALVLAQNMNIWDLIEASDLIVSINSTVAFEALLRKKKVILLGEGVLGNVGLVERTRTAELEKTIPGRLNARFSEHFDYSCLLRFVHFLLRDYYIFRDKPPIPAAVMAELQNKVRVPAAKDFSRKDLVEMFCSPTHAVCKPDRCRDNNADAVKLFLEAGTRFKESDFAAAAECIQRYRTIVDYSKLARTFIKPKKESPDVSVVLVTYNRTDQLKSCLESLSRQDYKDFEVVVVDNGGTDIEAVAEHVDQYIKCPINFNLSEGRNIGACCAAGRIIAFVDDDAMVPDDYISSIKKAFEEYDIVGLRGKALPKTNPDANKAAQGYNKGDEPFPTFCDLEGDSAFLRETYLSFNGMDPLLFGHEGSDLTYRICTQCDTLDKIIYSPDTVIYHDAQTGESKSRRQRWYRLTEQYLKFKHKTNIFDLRGRIESTPLLPAADMPAEAELQSRMVADQLNMKMMGTEYGGWAVDLNLIPENSTVISAGVGEDISFDLSLIAEKNCMVIGVDPTDKAGRFVEQNSNPRFRLIQKALFSQSDQKVRIFKSSRDDYVSESLTPTHHTVDPSQFYDAETVALQDLFEMSPNVSVLKMDVEGAEYEVLNSLKVLNVPQICVEFHHHCTDFSAEDTRRCIKHLQEMGYIAAHTKEDADTIVQATFVHRSCLQVPQNEPRRTRPNLRAGEDVPVVLICYNRPHHTRQVLESLRRHNTKNLYVFSDAARSIDQTEPVARVRRLIRGIDWTTPEIIERSENLGLARSIVEAVEYVFERHDRLILLEDDCVPQRYFFDFMQTCLEKYESNPNVFGISGYTVPIPNSVLEAYPYDLYFCPRIGSWGWATWKRAWQFHEKDLRKLVRIANGKNIDLAQAGSDIPVFINDFLVGKLKDVWTLNWLLSVYVNHGFYIYPTKSHIKNIGTDGSGIHCTGTSKYDSPCSDRKPNRLPDSVFLDDRILQNFRSYYTADEETSHNAAAYLRSLKTERPLKIAYVSTVDRKGGAARVAWMLKEQLKARGHQTKMFVGQKISGDPDVIKITNPVIDNSNQYRRRGFLDYDIKSTFALAQDDELTSADILHFHNLHGSYFNPFAMPELTRIKPSVWTLHDMQGITGHCAYAFDCKKWQSGCGDCPDLATYPAITADQTAKMWRDKRAIYQQSDMEIIVPSQWLKNIVGKSILAEKKVHLIYNGIDHNAYKPLDKKSIRRMFKIPQEAVIIGFLANKGLMDSRKGGDYVLQAYKYLAAKYPNAFFISIGGISPQAPTERFLQVPFILDENKLAQLYNTMDIFLFPTLADNCPLVILEVMGCGIPVVSFKAGGVPELVEHGKTGLTAEYKNCEEFIRMTDHLIADKMKREEFAVGGRQKLLRMLTLEKMVDNHVCLYENLIEKSRKKNYVSSKNKVTLPAVRDQKEYKYLVSAIVSTYNSERFIRGCLEDLENQTIAGKLEIIIVDSGSQQNEEAIVRRFQQKHDNIVYIKTEQREGVYAAWNRAIRAARGEFITNANTDDRHRKDAFEIMAQALRTNPDIALVYGDQIRTDTPNDTFESHHGTEMLQRPEYSRQRLLFGCCVGSQPMWRRMLHDEFGWFDETLTCAADWDFWLRVAAKYDFKHIPERLGLYYHNKEGVEHSRQIHSLYERYIVGKRYANPYISVIPLYETAENPLVSVIMPAHNAADHVAEAIESVLIQNYRNFELIVVDDGSTDNTADIVAGFEEVKYFHKENAGPASARNLALKKSSGEFIVILDADDMVSPDFIARHLQEFARNRDADLVYCDDFLIDEDGRPIRVIERPDYTQRTALIRDLFRNGFPVVPFRTCIRRSVFETIGLYDEKLLVGEDYDMIRRFVKHGLKVHHLRDALYLRRMSPTSLTRGPTAQKAQAHFEALRRYTQTFAPEELFPDIAWDGIPAQTKSLHARCCATATYLAIGKAYMASTAPLYAQASLGLACTELTDCCRMLPGSHRLHKILAKCEGVRTIYDELGAKHNAQVIESG